MFKEAKIQAVVEYECDICKRNIAYMAQLIEIDDLYKFKRELVTTMNMEGHRINDRWICPDCVVGK